MTAAEVSWFREEVEKRYQALKHREKLEGAERFYERHPPKAYDRSDRVMAQPMPEGDLWRVWNPDTPDAVDVVSGDYFREHFRGVEDADQM